jgi:hypothetical protein
MSPEQSDIDMKAALFVQVRDLGGTVRLSQDGERFRGEVRWPDGYRYGCCWPTTRDVLADLRREVDRVGGNCA